MSLFGIHVIGSKHEYAREGTFEMGSYVRVTGSGQITLPSRLRQKHGIEKGDRVFVDEDADGNIVISNPGEAVRRLRGMFPPRPGVEPGEDFDEVIHEAFDEGYARHVDRDNAGEWE